jgi:hypothetical protein
MTALEIAAGQEQPFDAFAFEQIERLLLAGMRTFTIKRSVQNNFDF